MTIHMVFPATLDDTQDFCRPFLEQARHKQTLGFAWALCKREAWNKVVLPRRTDFMLSMTWRFF